MLDCHRFANSARLCYFVIVLAFTLFSQNILDVIMKYNMLPLIELYEAINNQENLHPAAAFLVAGNFNSASLRHTIPNFHQHVSFTTRGNKVLDRGYSTHKQDTRPSLVRHSLNQIMAPYSCFLFTSRSSNRKYL